MRNAFITVCASIFFASICGQTAVVAGEPQEPTNTEKAREVIDAILAHPEQGAISVHYINGSTQWERHFNADRLNSLASTFKVVSLIAYGHAVASGELHPNELRTKEDWARFLAGGDGGALERAWERLGEPDLVTIDQMAGAMMQESDNAMPDWIFDELGEAALASAIEKYFTPPKTAAFHDPPRSINAMFLTWDENPIESQIGDRIAASFSDGGTFGFRREVAQWFELLRHPAFVEQVRQYRCAFPPWEVVDNCTPPSEEDATSEPNLKRLQENFF